MLAALLYKMLISMLTSYSTGIGSGIGIPVVFILTLLGMYSSIASHDRSDVTALKRLIQRSAIGSVAIILYYAFVLSVWPPIKAGHVDIVTISIMLGFAAMQICVTRDNVWVLKLRYMAITMANAFGASVSSMLWVYIVSGDSTRDVIYTLVACLAMPFYCVVFGIVICSYGDKSTYYEINRN